MGSVERVLVLGIVVVIVAILGIAVWGATGDDAGSLAKTATDGGAVVADGPASPALKTPRKDASAAAVEEIDRWSRARNELRKQSRQPSTPQDNSVPLKNDVSTSQPLTVKPRLTPETPRAASTRPAVPGPIQRTARKPVNPTPVAPKTKGPIKYTVVSGDNLWKLVNRYFGDSNIQENLDAILAANPSLDEEDLLQLGMEIVIPLQDAAKASAQPTMAAPKAGFSGDLYEVKAGDTLSEISSRLLGSSKRMNEIYELNRDRMTAPDKLQIGMTLRMPKR